MKIIFISIFTFSLPLLLCSAANRLAKQFIATELPPPTVERFELLSFIGQWYEVYTSFALQYYNTSYQNDARSNKKMIDSVAVSLRKHCTTHHHQLISNQWKERVFEIESIFKGSPSLNGSVVVLNSVAMNSPFQFLSNTEAPRSGHFLVQEKANYLYHQNRNTRKKNNRRKKRSYYWIIALGENKELTVYQRYRWVAISSPLRIELRILVRDVKEFQQVYEVDALEQMKKLGYTYDFHLPIAVYHHPVNCADVYSINNE